MDTHANPPQPTPPILFIVPLEPLPTVTGLSERDRIFLHQVLTLLLEALSYPTLPPQQDLYHQCIPYLMEPTESPASGPIPYPIPQGWHVQDDGNQLRVRPVQKLHPFKCLVVNVLTAYQTLVETGHPQRSQRTPPEMQRLGLKVCTQLLIRILDRSRKEAS